MQLPPSLLESLAGIPGYDPVPFRAVHRPGETVTSVRRNPFKPSLTVAGYSPGELLPVPWTTLGYYLPDRPSFTLDPLFHAGTYYVQEASSMFLEQALLQLAGTTSPLKVLDLCAAPGGKSTHLQSLISPDSLLVANEVIRSRTGILRDNIIKWGCGNVMVTQNDPADFAALESYFDVIVADAPCSGSGLFRREPEAVEEWSAGNVQLCSQRQQRILADVLPALKKEGILIYSTCSYSKEENEEISDWLQQSFSLEPVRLHIPGEWNIVESENGYRFWPDKIKGEGFFLACFRKTEGANPGKPTVKRKPAALTAQETKIVQQWVKAEGIRFIKNDTTVYAWPEPVSEDFSLLLGRLHVIYSGLRAGELMRDKLIPDHALALGRILQDLIPRQELDREQAVRFLQKKDLAVSPAEKGWQLACHAGHPLGWMNVLQGRINNYYPKGLRILKES